MRMVVIHSVESLLIGVPLKTRSGPTAIIEVVQRATSHPDARTGYLRFVRSMAALVDVGSSRFDYACRIETNALLFPSRKLPIHNVDVSVARS